MKDGFGDGSRKFQQLAMQAFPLLVAQAKAGNIITYGELARQMEVHPRSFAYALGAIGLELRALGKKWRSKIPPINCLVVNKHKKTPGKGIKFHMSFREFESLTPIAKKKLMDQLFITIWGYPRWDDVLRAFGMKAVIPAEKLKPILTEAKYGRGGGETLDHRLLKEFLFEHPERLGLPQNGKLSKESAFASTDRVDILFKSDKQWVGIEVKGMNAPEPELARGIFQCIKYRALIEATQKSEQIIAESRVILAIGGKLSHELENLAVLLQIECQQGIAVPASFQRLAKS